MAGGADNSLAKKQSYAKGDSYHHRDLREAMIQVAQQLLEDEGPGGWTVRAAARAAGVSSGAPYRHFADKEALLAAVATRGFEELRDEIELALAGAEDDSLERFRLLGAAYVRFALARPGRYSIMFGRDLLHREQHPELLTASDRTYESLLREVERAQARGSMRSDRDAHELASAAWASIHGLSDLALSGRLNGSQDDPGRTTARVGRLLFEGLLAH